MKITMILGLLISETVWGTCENPSGQVNRFQYNGFCEQQLGDNPLTGEKTTLRQQNGTAKTDTTYVKNIFERFRDMKGRTTWKKSLKRLKK